MFYASFVSGADYLPEARDLADRNLFLGGMAADNYVAFYPNSAVLTHMNRWLAALFATRALSSLMRVTRARKRGLAPERV